MRRIMRENTGLMEAGQDLVAAGFAGCQGSAVIAQEKREELLRRLSTEYVEQAASAFSGNLPGDFRYWRRMGASEFEPAGEGGILTALWNLSGAYSLGIEFSLRKIPLRQDTVEICELYGLNPYRLLSGGCAVLTSSNGGRLAENLAAAGIPAAVIGRVKRGIAREILTSEGTGYLERPQEDELKKVLPLYFGESGE